MSRPTHSRTRNIGLELCADVIVSAAARRSISVGGGGAPLVQQNRRRRRRGAAWAVKNIFSKIHLGMGVADPGQEISISTGKFPQNFNFWGNFTKEYRILQANFRKFWFFQAIKKIRFSKQKIVHLQLPLGKLFYFSSKVATFEHTSCTW